MVPSNGTLTNMLRKLTVTILILWLWYSRPLDENTLIGRFPYCSRNSILGHLKLNTKYQISIKHKIKTSRINVLRNLLFNQRRHIVSESHYLGKRESLKGSKTSAREHPSISGGPHRVLEAPHKYNQCVERRVFEIRPMRSRARKVPTYLVLLPRYHKTRFITNSCRDFWALLCSLLILVYSYLILSPYYTHMLPYVWITPVYVYCKLYLYDCAVSQGRRNDFGIGWLIDFQYPLSY